MKADIAFERYLSRLGSEGSFFTSVIVEGEVLFGIERLPRGRRRKNLTQAFRQVLNGIREILPITREIGSLYSKVKSELWVQGKPMGENDLWLAATAVTHGLILVTEDGFFRNVEKLVVEDWAMA